MKCSIKLFAGIRETIGAQDVSLDIYPGMTALECREKPGDLIRTSRLAVSNAFVLDEDPLIADSSIELALIPPVSGG